MVGPLGRARLPATAPGSPSTILCGDPAGLRIRHRQEDGVIVHQGGVRAARAWATRPQTRRGNYPNPGPPRLCGPQTLT